ncbi:C-X-C motif chemokine 5-like isoform X1 [Poecilia formosa]|uniref:C-X-C motif chemokine 5-like isoform X1 n=1 Tax=Poecilia formosa TaxID=48698 RepID=UPI0007BA6EA2|nr:PREDICTED: C-X-C motif chemokine 5-like isoform X1 [Poecilia formosa]
MKSAVQLIVLLACVFLCTSGNPITKCRCIETIPVVRRALIADVKVYEPYPLCSKREVIVVRKDNKVFCLDQESNFTKRLLEMVKRKINVEGTLSKTTAAATTAAATTQKALRSQPPQPAEEADLLAWLTWDPTAN